jgi:BirA family biotin operon repressor/biotin-[acetyl-CoA-carboxylase] ligase
MESCDSTNTRLKQLAAEGAEEGTVVIALEQTGGRGRMGRNWASTKDSGIWMSILLRPDLHPMDVQVLTLAASVAVIETLQPHLSEKPGIKWPNDILVDGRKICGILTELSAEIDRVNYVIVGIGLNTAQTTEDFPQELQSTATSIFQHRRTGSRQSMDEWDECKTVDEMSLPDRNRITAELLMNIERTYDKLILGNVLEILEKWKEYSVTIGQEITVISLKGPWNALALDITKDGRLIVQKTDGTRHEVLSGEISITRPRKTEQ